MHKRIVLVGAGSAQFGFGTLGDVFQSETLRGSTIVLHDINAVSLARVKETALDFISQNKLDFHITATTDRAEAFHGADFVIISIEAGDRFKFWEEDWRVPQQFGIRQVYGENGGPGGLFHSLRIIPPILEICADAQRICPNAWIFNYSNPMSRICTTVSRAFPDLKFVGLCHEIASLPQFLPLILGVPYDALEIRAAGLNHFSAILTAKYRETGQDAYPDILARAPGLFESMPKMEAVYKYMKETGFKPDDLETLSSFETEAWSEHRLFKVILEKFKLFPVTSDSHFGEYIHWAADVVDHKGILDFYRFYKDFLSKVEPLIELKLKERVVPIIEGILTDSGYVEEAVNLPNHGLIADLPDWIVVEVPAKIDKQGVHGLPVGHLPKGFAGLLLNQVAVHDLTTEAILKKSKTAALQALLVDPNVDHFHGMEDLLETMIDYQQPWLDYLQ